MANNHLRIAAGVEESADACARYVLESLEETLKTKPSATFAISGGSTPKLLFARLAKADFDWSRVHFFWVDERCVPPGDDQSNFKLANNTLFIPAEVKHTNIHRILGELTPEEGAIQYIEEISKFFGLETGQLPEFDLIHRGMGPDGHTASLFPGEPLIENRTGIAAAVWVEKMRSHRVTLLPGVLLKAQQTILQVVGADKAEVLREVLKGPEDPMRYPCQIAARNSETATWFLDKAAASKL
ncbi:MAG: 6-phosphogluconolactonase [Acidobacteriaceae bacterium]|nr:6-phosphogluconolactonase [Acidobacteriaceae bacterium]